MHAYVYCATRGAALDRIGVCPGQLKYDMSPRGLDNTQHERQNQQHDPNMSRHAMPCDAHVMRSRVCVRCVASVLRCTACAVMLLRYRGLIQCLMRNTAARNRQMAPTTIYATPKKSFFPPSHDVVEITTYFSPEKAPTGNTDEAWRERVYVMR